MWSKKDEGREGRAAETPPVPLLPVAEEVQVVATSTEQTRSRRVIEQQPGQQQQSGISTNPNFLTAHAVATVHNDYHEEVTENHGRGAELANLVAKMFFFVWACIATSVLGMQCILTYFLGVQSLDQGSVILKPLIVVGCFAAAFHALKRLWKAYYAQEYGVVFVLPVFTSMVIATFTWRLN